MQLLVGGEGGGSEREEGEAFSVSVSPAGCRLQNERSCFPLGLRGNCCFFFLFSFIFFCLSFPSWATHQKETLQICFPFIFFFFFNLSSTCLLLFLLPCRQLAQLPSLGNPLQWARSQCTPLSPSLARSEQPPRRATWPDSRNSGQTKVPRGSHASCQSSLITSERRAQKGSPKPRRRRARSARLVEMDRLLAAMCAGCSDTRRHRCQRRGCLSVAALHSEQVSFKL